jgi:hypothetical protein
LNHAIQRRTLQEELDSLVVKTPGADAPPKGDLEVLNVNYFGLFRAFGEAHN